MNIENARKIIDDSTTMTAVEALAFTEAIEQLAEAKRLLKQAVDDISVLLELNDSCYYCKHYVAGECLCVDDCNRSCEWHCTDDALKLLGGSETIKG